MIRLSNLIILIIAVVPLSWQLFARQGSESQMIQKLKSEIDSGQIAFRLTEIHELRSLLGDPDEEKSFQDGGMLVYEMVYPQVQVIFTKFKRDVKAPFTLFAVKIKDQLVDIGRDSKITLRGNHDLAKLDNFRGFQNVSLKNVNLATQVDFIQKMSFDNLTEWPAKDKLPAGFNPIEILETHKTPGLNIKKLHKQGITGKGIGIAIIDQPLLLGHEEYKSQITRYDTTGMSAYAPQMHGSPIVFIAVGKNIGVAPDASVSYFAVPMWKNENAYYINAMEKIFALNEVLPEDEKIRIVSISDGSFSSYPQYDKWQSILRKAEQMDIFVVTCDPLSLDFGTLNTITAKDPDNFENYIKNTYASENSIILIPAGNRTLASYRGSNVYVFDRDGGRSWAAPYIAGLAALAFQIKPQITPSKIRKLLIKTARHTLLGAIVNPVKFIENVKKE